MSFEKTRIPTACGKNYRAVVYTLMSGTVLSFSWAIGSASQTCAQSAPLQGAAAEQAITINIPAGPLNESLLALSRKASLQIFYDMQKVKDLKAEAVSGTMTPDEAMSRILAGSGYTFSRTGNHISILKQSSGIMLGPVRVGGISRVAVPSTAMIGNLPPALPGGEIARGGQLGMLGNRDVMDTPFNSTSYTAEFIEKRQIRSVRDALKDDPSVRAIFSTGTAGVERIQIRGFTLDDVDMSYGGLYGLMPFSGITSELAERIEVLRGPAALLNGMSPGGAVGGVVNIVPKRAHDRPMTRIEADYTSNAQFGGHADLGRRFGKKKQLGVRLNGMIRSGPTSVPYNSQKTALVATGVDLRLHRVRLSADFGYQHREIDGVLPYYSLGKDVSVPDAGKVKRNFHLPWSYFSGNDYFGVFRGEVDIFRNITAYGSVGVHDYEYRGAYSQQIVVNDAQGNGKGAVPVGIVQSGRYLTADLGVRGQVKSGPVTQDLAFSANRLDLTMGRIFGSNSDISAYDVNIYGGKNKFLLNRDVSVPKSSPKSGTSTLSSLAFVDTLSALSKRIQVTAGLRVQRVQSASFNTTTGMATSRYDRTAISPSVLAVFKPMKNLSIYGNWIQGLQQGSVVGTNYANAGEIFAPYKSTQYEVGAKYDLKRFIVSADVFQITQPSTVYDLKTNIMSVNGKQRNRGLELNIVGEILHGLRATGGVMLLNPILTKTQGGTYDGMRASNTATVNFNMGFDYDIPFVKGAAVTSDIMYTSSEYIENATSNRRRIPGWVRLDLGARYAMKNPAERDGKLTFALNVDNVTNARYWNASGANYLSLSIPRTFRFAVTADF
ncbi:TonB-dependent receptor [Acetobacter thailandicus]|uniref:TonB-dependent receptor n=1 Tax=Acetobacter thailandicus TaxID=1502842 RepID=UPI001BA809E7|nr:TonB-dependent receptor [Acetobacter thailandicus]MBS0986071.1 TonB-dependent receptor [Acetobacter thailandicus]